MKRLIAILLILFCFGSLCACDDGKDHTNEAKTPSSSSMMSGRDYQEVQKIFEKKGFTNIKLVAIEDLIVGWFTKDGEVEKVSVGGDVKYSPDKWYPKDTEVIIWYHTFPSEEDSNSSGNEHQPEDDDKNQESNNEDVILTVDNCSELADILSKKTAHDQAFANFASKYRGKTIKFNGRIDYLAKHGDYNTRYDILVSAGDYDPDHQIGPTFKFEDVGVYDLDLDTLYLEDVIKIGMNVVIIAKVDSYNINTNLFFLDPVSVTKR